MCAFSLVKIIKDTIQAKFIKGTQLTIFSLHKISFMIQMKNFPLCYTSSNSLKQNNLIDNQSWKHIREREKISLVNTEMTVKALKVEDI